MINDVPKRDADATLCTLIISSSDACTGCALNVQPEPLSDYLSYICELNEIISAGARLELSFGEWKALALLKRKYQEAELKKMKERSNG